MEHSHGTGFRNVGGFSKGLFFSSDLELARPVVQVTHIVVFRVFGFRLAVFVSRRHVRIKGVRVSATLVVEV